MTKTTGGSGLAFMLGDFIQVTVDETNANTPITASITRSLDGQPVTQLTGLDNGDEGDDPIYVLPGDEVTISGTTGLTFSMDSAALQEGGFSEFYYLLKTDMNNSLFYLDSHGAAVNVSAQSKGAGRGDASWTWTPSIAAANNLSAEEFIEDDDNAALTNDFATLSGATLTISEDNEVEDIGRVILVQFASHTYKVAICQAYNMSATEAYDVLAGILA